MSLQKIKDWLSDPNREYDKGLALYEQFKTDSKRDGFYRSGKSTIHSNMLYGDLTRIARILEQKQVADPFKAAVKLPEIKLERDTTPKVVRKALSVKIVDDVPSVSFEKLPEELKEKYNEIKSLTKTLAEDYAILTKEGISDDNRKVVAERICAGFDKRKENWIEIDVWAENEQGGKGDKNPEEMTAEEVKLSIKIKRDSINRALKNPNPKNKEKRDLSIKKWEQEINFLETFLKQREPKQ